jgi:hypothetical protein
MKKFDQVRSPENIAALMAPKEENAMLMQRMEDPSRRQLSRPNEILLKLRKRALNPTEMDEEELLPISQ